MTNISTIGPKELMDFFFTAVTVFLFCSGILLQTEPYCNHLLDNTLPRLTGCTSDREFTSQCNLLEFSLSGDRIPASEYLVCLAQ